MAGELGAGEVKSGAGGSLKMQPVESAIIMKLVMPGLVPGIHVLTGVAARKTWMAGTSPAMTKKRIKRPLSGLFRFQLRLPLALAGERVHPRAVREGLLAGGDIFVLV